MNIRSATPDTLGPLPFHGMSRYPYGPDEHYPDDPAHTEYLERDNIRAVPRVVPSIDAAALGRAAIRRTMTIRYSAAACQTDFPNPLNRSQMSANTDRMLAMIDAAIAGAAPFLPVRLVVFPEFAHAAPAYATAAELIEHLAVPIPNEHTDRLHRKAREHGIFIQSGSMIEADPRWPGVVFNATCLIGPDGILYKYRKVNPWIPYESAREPARPARLRRAAVPGGRYARSAGSAAPSATTGCFPRPSVSSPPTAPRC